MNQSRAGGRERNAPTAPYTKSTIERTSDEPLHMNNQRREPMFHAAMFPCRPLGANPCASNLVGSLHLLKFNSTRVLMGPLEGLFATSFRAPRRVLTCSGTGRGSEKEVLP
jgi:hypothetical protein